MGIPMPPIPSTDASRSQSKSINSMATTQPVLQKKVCMLGGFSVGKTSLVRRYVESIFSDTYLTTVGVKIDKKTVATPDRTVTLILWDVAGEDDVSTVKMSYLRGAAGYVLV